MLTGQAKHPDPARQTPLCFSLSSPDTILSKLERYRLGNESSERQWDDVVRVLKILGGEADLAYLKRNAAEPNVSDLLKKLIDSTQ